MTYVKRTTSDKAIQVDDPVLQEFLNRELLPVVRECRKQINRLTSIKTVTEDYTLTPDDYIVLVDASSNAVTITCKPVTEILGYEYVIKAIDATNVVTFDPDGDDTVDGAASIALVEDEVIRVHNDRVDDWLIV